MSITPAELLGLVAPPRRGIPVYPLGHWEDPTYAAGGRRAGGPHRDAQYRRLVAIARELGGGITSDLLAGLGDVTVKRAASYLARMSERGLIVQVGRRKARTGRPWVVWKWVA